MMTNDLPRHSMAWRKASTGFSLVEMLAATTFLLVVMLVLSQGMMVAIGTNVNGKNNTQALAIAQRLVEDLQNRHGQTLAGYNNLAVTADPQHPTVINYSMNGDVITNEHQRPAYVVTQTVSPDPSADASYKVVSVTVTPQVKGLGKTQPVSVETYIIKPQS